MFIVIRDLSVYRSKFWIFESTETKEAKSFGTCRIRCLPMQPAIIVSSQKSITGRCVEKRQCKYA